MLHFAVSGYSLTNKAACNYWIKTEKFSEENSNFLIAQNKGDSGRIAVQSREPGYKITHVKWKPQNNGFIMIMEALVLRALSTVLGSWVCQSTVVGFIKLFYFICGIFQFSSKYELHRAFQSVWFTSVARNIQANTKYEKPLQSMYSQFSFRKNSSSR